ncbi:MAG: restriction endonuclease subunit S [Selenomonas massiliensis]
MHYEKFADGTIKCIEDEIPFEVPKGWAWARLGDVGIWGAGATPSRAHPEFYDGTIPWLKTGDLTDTYITSISENISQLALEKTSVRINPVGSVLIAMYGATIGKLGILTFPATTNQACCACTPLSGVEELYLFYFLMSQRAIFIKRGEGGAQPNISKEKIISTLIPIPPSIEQKRIIEKIESYELLLLTLNNSKIKLEEVICLCKSKILDLAIRGKLVPQDESDEPASVLLEQIQVEKEELIRQGKIKRDKRESVIYQGADNSYYERFADGSEKCIGEEIPFEIPDSWTWVRLGHIIKNIQYGLSSSAEISGTCHLLRITDIQNGKVDWDTVPYTSTNNLDKYLLHINDILFARTGATVGKSFLVTQLPCDSVYASYLIRVQLLDNIWIQYIHNFFNSNSYWAQIRDKMVGVGQPNCNGTSLKELLIPFPPHLEQKRITLRMKDLINKINSMIDHIS